VLLPGILGNYFREIGMSECDKKPDWWPKCHRCGIVIDLRDSEPYYQIKMIFKDLYEELKGNDAHFMSFCENCEGEAREKYQEILFQFENL